MVTLFLRQGRHLVDEGHRCQEIHELEALVDMRLTALGSQLPALNLAQELVRRRLVQRGGPTFTRHASLFCQSHLEPPRAPIFMGGRGWGPHPPLPSPPAMGSDGLSPSAPTRT